MGEEKVRWYLKLTRPFTTLPAVPGGLILYLAVNDVNMENIVVGLLVGLSLACVQAVGQIVNQVVDIELDRYVKPHRPLPQGKVTVDEALGLAFGLAILGALVAISVSYYYTLAYMVMIFLAVFYSLPPFTPRHRSAWLNHIWVSASRSLVPFLAVMGLEGLTYAVIAFVWAVGWQGSKDVLDADYDRAFGIKTLANVYGVDTLISLAFLSTMAIAFLSILTFKPVFLLSVAYGVHGVWRYMERWRGENVYGWFVFYTGLALIGLLAFMDAKVL